MWTNDEFAPTAAGLHLPSEITKIVYAKIAADAKLLQQIVDNAKRGTKIDHALEDPDTIVDDCEVRKTAKPDSRYLAGRLPYPVACACTLFGSTHQDGADRF